MNSQNFKTKIYNFFPHITIYYESKYNKDKNGKKESKKERKF